MTAMRLIHGDCLEVMDQLAAEGVTVDAVVTDPPYELGFMGKAWDKSGIAFQSETWARCLRLLKPGGHLLAFGGTRTIHRIVCAIEDAGFDIRDMVSWVYGQGFPKSLDVGKAIDSAPEAKQWDGWHTALKPAVEPICLARKPLDGPVARNVLEYGTGAINVDGCRVGQGNGNPKPEYIANNGNAVYGKGMGGGAWENTSGRCPANLIHDGSPEVLAEFAKAGERNTTWVSSSHANNRDGDFLGELGHPGEQGYNDKGTAARFFYCAKANKAERNGSKHPTVKPLALMRYLVRLITPPGGIVLDPFAGSGTTGQAAQLEGMQSILIEREAEYVGDIERRLGEDPMLWSECPDTEGALTCA